MSTPTVLPHVSHTILTGDVLTILPTLPSNSHHGCLTDAPYELGFMGKSWDKSGIAFNPTLWAEVLRILTPGSYLLAFGGTRTYHRMTCAIEDAGFEIRDCLMWMYGTGFPKSHACLKPSYEPIVLARKPAAKALPLNIDGCRVGDSGGCKYEGGSTTLSTDAARVYKHHLNGARSTQVEGLGRWPANTILDESVAAELGDKSRYFYCAKASRKERDAGLEGFEPSEGVRTNAWCENEQVKTAPRKNNHPTVKPLSLCEHLAKLILPNPPPDTQQRLLAPFSGSGSEMIGAMQAGWPDITGIELSPGYVAIAEARLGHWENK